MQNPANGISINSQFKVKHEENANITHVKVHMRTHLKVKGCSHVEQVYNNSFEVIFECRLCLYIHVLIWDREE
jgi:hypothetical protein